MFFSKPLGGEYAAAYQWQGYNFSECGPAALAMVVRQHRNGSSVSRHTCRAKQPTPSWWTAHSIISAGTELATPVALAHYAMHRRAGIYLSSYWGFGHWVVAWKRADNRVQVLDPKRGVYVLTESAFKRRLKSNVYVATDVIF